MTEATTDATLTLATLRAGQRLRGLVPGQTVTLIAIDPILMLDLPRESLKRGRRHRHQQLRSMRAPRRAAEQRLDCLDEALEKIKTDDFPVIRRLRIADSGKGGRIKTNGNIQHVHARIDRHAHTDVVHRIPRQTDIPLNIERLIFRIHQTPLDIPKTIVTAKPLEGHRALMDAHTFGSRWR